jgi:uncharacterized GH25 family protein
MMMKTFRFAAPVVVALVSAAGSAHAHHVWLEQDASGARFCFGEFGENVRESSPGRLDKFVQPAAKRLTAKGEQPVTLTKGAEGFALSARAEAGESLVVEETRYPVLQRKDGEKAVRTAWTPAARWIADFGARPPVLGLDVVPTGRNENGAIELQVTFKAQPLPKATVSILAASGWVQEHHADERGKLTVTAPWKGAYVVLVRHSDPTPGQRPTADGSEAYDVASYATTLSFVQPEGLIGPPPPVAAARRSATPQ